MKKYEYRVIPLFPKDETAVFFYPAQAIKLSVISVIRPFSIFNKKYYIIFIESKKKHFQ